jgi:hypothetical protein
MNYNKEEYNKNLNIDLVELLKTKTNDRIRKINPEIRKKFKNAFNKLSIMIKIIKMKFFNKSREDGNKYSNEEIFQKI